MFLNTLGSFLADRQTYLNILSTPTYSVGVGNYVVVNRAPQLVGSGTGPDR